MNEKPIQERLREIPAVDEIMRQDAVMALLEKTPRPLAESAAQAWQVVAAR